MFAQVNGVRCNEEGVAEQGVIVRVLLIPSLTHEAKAILRFLAEQVSREIHITLMRQYRPVYRAREYPELDGYIDARTYGEVLHYGEELGLKNIISQ